jgi:hypothetical protein
MKHLLQTVGVFLLIAACNGDDDHSISNCDEEVIVNAGTFQTAPNDDLVVNRIEINGNCMTINFSASGCDGNSWEIKLIDSGEVISGNPPRRNIRLSLKNNEDCLAFLTREISFDIEPLQVQGGQALLNLTNNDAQILYEY